MKTRIPTDHDMEILPHIILSSDADWDPNASLDNDPPADDLSWYNSPDLHDNHGHHSHNSTSFVCLTHKPSMINSNMDDIDHFSTFMYILSRYKRIRKSIINLYNLNLVGARSIVLNAHSRLLHNLHGPFICM
jgi:hypothetical protein